MTTAKESYADVKATMEAVQRLPEEAQRTILKMMYGAIAISDLYSMSGQCGKVRDSA